MRETHGNEFEAELLLDESNGHLVLNDSGVLGPIGNGAVHFELRTRTERGEASFCA